LEIGRKFSQQQKATLIIKL